MSTSSTIAILKNDGTVDSIFCHYDGYLKHVGVVLHNHYSNVSKLKDLINLGSLRSLGKNINFPKGKSYHKNGNNKNFCIFHYRDLEGPRIKIEKFKSFIDYADNNHTFQEYNYLYDESKQEWLTFDFNNNAFSSLKLDILNSVLVDDKIKEAIIVKDRTKQAAKLDAELVKKGNDFKPKIKI